MIIVFSSKLNFSLRAFYIRLENFSWSDWSELKFRVHSGCFEAFDRGGKKGGEGEISFLRGVGARADECDWNFIN